MQTKYHVKKGDKVQVISGVWKGAEAEVVTILKKKDRVVLNMTTEINPENQPGNRTVKRSQQNTEGGLVARSYSVHVSNVKKI
jgi:large subunit ribosomal protein L24